MSNIAAKRSPDAPRTIADAIGDIDSLHELMKELDDSSLVQALVKAGTKSQLIQAFYWSCRSGVTEDHLNTALANQQTILELSKLRGYADFDFSVDAWKETGLPDATPLASAQEALITAGKEFDLTKVYDIIQESTRHLAEVEAIKPAPITPASIYGANVKLCDRCGLKPGTLRYALCDTILKADVADVRRGSFVLLPVKKRTGPATSPIVSPTDFVYSKR
jgi:hypothetical protein